MFGWPHEDLAFGDVMADLATLLRNHTLLEDVTVSSDMSKFQQGDRMLLLERAGGRRDRLFDDSHVLFEARGEDHDDAYDIAMAARSICWTVPKLIGPIVKVSDVSGPLRIVDPVNQDLFYRFSMMFRVKGKRPSEL